MHFWIEAINNSSSKPSTPEIMRLPSPILSFKQDQLLPNRELPVPPTTDILVQDYCYDKPNPIIRSINLYENAIDEVDMESIYHFIDESKREKETTILKVYHPRYYYSLIYYYNNILIIITVFVVVNYYSPLSLTFMLYKIIYFSRSMNIFVMVTRHIIIYPAIYLCRCRPKEIKIIIRLMTMIISLIRKLTTTLL